MKYCNYYTTLIVLLLGFVPSLSYGSHIVGGEIQVKQVGTNRFEFTLNMYFDILNGLAAAEDDEVTINVFSKRTGLFIEEFTLPQTYEEEINYSNPACKLNSLRTKLIRYNRTFTLNPNSYSDSEGYYVVWERCCRNNIINNIINPGGTGMVFYTEFPGTRITNSTPIFSLPKGDYACRNEWFYFDFKATDADGDQLVYRLSTPWAGNTSPSNPVISPRRAPYREIIWQAGYSLSNMIPGFPALSIDSQTGMLSFRASQVGLFVFTVICEEYRGGSKIGEVRRDYQLSIIECPFNAPPQVEIKQRGKSSFYKTGDTLYIRSDEERCFDAFVSDPDNGSILTLSTVGVNFNQAHLTAKTTQVNTNNGMTAQLELCWAACTFVSAQQPSFIVDVIVQDNGCPLPKKDTVRITLVSVPPPNSVPTITTTLASLKPTLTVNEVLSFDVIGNDADNDNITVEAIGRGFDVRDLGVNFPKISAIGNIRQNFTWQTSCSNIAEVENLYIIDFIITDQSQCFQKKDTVTVEINLKDLPFDDSNFLPPSVFTPNADGKNDAYFIPQLPNETCLFYFKKIEIFTRWGNKIFESADRNFRWNGTTAAAGAYYYIIDYNRKKYKNTITIVK
ncbi:MAG: gliding motility-associated C-terminal domain-containing protein [Cytophagales bacterium]|nr:MAG: gliding motility-associated C-terminal domain-containing protein [Cytophagales bacterium]